MTKNGSNGRPRATVEYAQRVIWKQGPKESIYRNNITVGEIDMEQITTLDQLKRKLKIDNFDELKNPKVLKRFQKLAQHITPELSRELVRAAPAITKAFTDYLSSLNKYGGAVENTKQHRWQFLSEVVKTGQMTGDQLFEAMQILGDMDSRDTRSFTEHREHTSKIAEKALDTAKAALAVACAAAVCALGFITKNLIDKSNGSNEA